MNHGSVGAFSGQWASGRDPEPRSGSHGRYYSFTLEQSPQVTVSLVIQRRFIW